MSKEDEWGKELVEEQYDDEVSYIEGEDITETKDGKVQYKKVNHKDRADEFKRISDGNTTTYMNYALEYFGYRCALSGEEFRIFDEPITRGDSNQIYSNLSSEHVVALCTGGNDIIPNLVPSVYQYNIQKNGYYLLDWWPKAKDIEGKPLYTPERLLKIVNYMLKSLEIRQELGVKKQPKTYRKKLLTPNEIDEYLSQIAEQDSQTQNNSEKKILSDTITATTLDEDNKKILTHIPDIDGNIPSLLAQSKSEIDIDETVFLTDAIRLLEKEKMPKEITDKLSNMLQGVIGEIPFEITVRNQILQVLENNGFIENKYSVANDMLLNTEILEQAKKMQNNNDIQQFINDYLSTHIESLKAILNEEQIKIAITHIPNILYDKSQIERIQFLQKYRVNHLQEYLEGKSTATDDLIDMLIILKQHKIDILRMPMSNKELEEWLNENKNEFNVADEEIQDIIDEIKVKGITNLNIGRMQAKQKLDENIGKYTIKLEELNEIGILREEEVKALTEKKQISQDQTKDLIDIIIILKQHKIDITKIPNSDKQLEEWLNENTDSFRITDNDIKNIIDEIKAKGITNLNIGNMQNNQKSDKNIETYQTKLEELKKIGILSDKEIKALTYIKKRQNQTQNLVDMIIILKQYEIDITKIPQSNKQLENWLNENKDSFRITDNDIKKIIDEIKTKGITNLNIGSIQSKQRSDKNIETYKTKLEELYKAKILSDEEVKALTERQRSEDLTQDLIDMIIILKQYEIDITKIPQSNKQLEQWLNENKDIFIITNEEIQEIIDEIKAKGITNLNIGSIQSIQKKDKNIKTYKTKLEELYKAKILSDEEVKILTGKKQISQDQIQDLVDMIIILKQHKIDITKIPLSDKQLEEWLNENKDIFSITNEEIQEIIDEIKAKGITNLNIGSIQSKQRSDENIETYKTKLEELKEIGILSEEEVKMLTGKKQISQDQTQDLVYMIIILKQHKIDITKIPQSNKQLEEWLNENKDIFSITNEEIQEIIDEIKAKGITNLNIGDMQNTQKRDKSKETYKTKLEELYKEKILSNEEIKALTERQKSENPTKDLVDIIIILKQHKIDITKIPQSNKQLEDWLNENKDKFNITDNDIATIIEEIKANGIINLNIGNMQKTQKKNKYIETYKTELKKLLKARILDDKEVEALTKKKKCKKKITQVIQDNKSDLSITETGQEFESELAIAEQGLEVGTNDRTE